MSVKRTVEEQIFLERFGNRISEIRKANGISQVELAYEMDTDKANIRKIEAGRANVTILTLRKIATLLKIDIKELISDL